MVIIDTKLSLKLSDYNGDGKKDILWRNYQTGENTMWLMNGTTIAAAGNLPGFLPQVRRVQTLVTLTAMANQICYGTTLTQVRIRCG
jgi:hypothetical protein